MRKGIIILAALLLLVFALPAAAQEGGPVAAGLNSPRQLAFDENGVLYIAEVGTGGDITVDSPFGPAQAGGSGRVSVSTGDGTASLLLHGLPSRHVGGETLGSGGIAVQDNLLWIVLSQGALSNPFTYSIVGLDRTSLRVRQFIDVYSSEAALNPDGDIVDSNPVDIAFDSQGRMYIADAGCNCVWRWTPSPEMGQPLELYKTWTDNPVPTSVFVDASDNVYIGFLTGFPFPAGGSRIEQYDAAGNLVNTYTGLSTVVDVLVHEGTIYATEIAQFGDMGWMPSTGRIVTVSSSGVETFYANLNMPYGLAVNPNGEILVAINAAYSDPGSGMVINASALRSMVGSEEGGEGGVEAPATTPEASAGS